MCLVLQKAWQKPEQALPLLFPFASRSNRLSAGRVQLQGITKFSLIVHAWARANTQDCGPSQNPSPWYCEGRTRFPGIDP